MLAEGTLSGGVPNPETIDTSKLPKLYLDWIEIEAADKAAVTTTSVTVPAAL